MKEYQVIVEMRGKNTCDIKRYFPDTAEGGEMVKKFLELVNNMYHSACGEKVEMTFNKNLGRYVKIASKQDGSASLRVDIQKVERDVDNAAQPDTQG